jgi:outer membrane murein-binding lipoprotein Lpp
MKKWFVAILASLLISGCGHFGLGKAPSRDSSNKIANDIGVQQNAFNDRAAGNNSAIEFTAQQLPASREKEVILLFAEDQFRLLGHPKAETETEFQKVAKQLLSQNLGEREKGEQARVKLTTDTEALKAQLENLKKDFEKARAQEAAEHRAELDRVKLEAAQEERRLVSYIFFGAAALLGIAGVIVIMTASSVPMFGPKVGMGLLAAGAVSGVTGVGILALMKQLDEHPWIIWLGLVVILLLVGVAGAIAYTNHQHHKDSNGSTT